MKAVPFIFFFSSAALIMGQDNSASRLQPGGEAVQAKRIRSVTWDMQNQKLVWVVENGVTQNGKFVASSEDRYEISPQNRSMAFQGEQRGFTQQEAVWLQHLLDVLTMYCAESTVWWLDGEGQPIPGGGPGPTGTPQQQDQPKNQPDNSSGRVKVRDPHTRPAPEAVRPGMVQLIAREMVY